MARERRVPWLVLGVLLVAGSGLAFAVWAQSIGDRHPVLALARSIEAGETLTPAHLTVARVGTDADLAFSAPTAADDLVGTVATASLPAGTLVHPTLFADRALVDPGDALVGLTVLPGELPLGGLRSGDRVVVVETPTDLDAADRSAPRALWAAAVVASATTTDEAGIEHVTVSLRVDAFDAGEISAAAARGAVRLVLVSSFDGVPLGGSGGREGPGGPREPGAAA